MLLTTATESNKLEFPCHQQATSKSKERKGQNHCVLRIDVTNVPPLSMCDRNVLDNE